jgi:hypothetical protein
LPSAYYRDPNAGNDALFTALSPHRDVLYPVPALRPDWPRWEQALRELLERGAIAVRAYPPQWGMGPHASPMMELASACGTLNVPLLLTVRFEDVRQRHWMDAAGDLSGAAIRALVRADARVRVVVTCAGRALIEEVHWGLAPQEQTRLWWDISWIWVRPKTNSRICFAPWVRSASCSAARGHCVSCRRHARISSCFRMRCVMLNSLTSRCCAM